MPFLGGTFRVRRKEVLVVGACKILSLIIVLSVVEKGYITRVNALLLILSWFFFMLIVRNFIKNTNKKPESKYPTSTRSYFYHFKRSALGFAGIAIGAYFVIQSVIVLSEIFRISEYIVSFLWWLLEHLFLSFLSM